MKITMAQLNPVVGDITANLKRLAELWSICHAQESDLLILSELYLVGYPPRDLLERPAFIDQVKAAIQEVLKLSLEYKGTGILFGSPVPTSNSIGHSLYNSALLIYQGEILLTQHKSLLPTYDVFDEARYFEPAAGIDTIEFKGLRLGITICEDAWNETDLWRGAVSYDLDPIKELVQKGIDLLINISASPYFVNKEDVRFRLMSKHARSYGVPLIYVNQVGANDELIFDGRSMFVDKDGEMVVLFSAFEEDVHTISTDQKGCRSNYYPQNDMQSLYQSLVLGIRDYFRKCGFSRAIIGLSGGIDSAVTACLAVAALGKENVLGISMPSVYSSVGSVDDSRSLACNLNIDFKIISIADIFSSYIGNLKEHFSEKESDVTEENIQARIRGNILMAFANKYGSMVLSTGNKSEIAVGYCTLYGDMCGGLSVLADVPKTMVYELTGYINRDDEVIPMATVEKAPSAELKPGQVDQDTLPPYDVLDAILNYYIEENLSAADIIAEGYDPKTVHWVLKTVNNNEYKRKQAAPGLKVSSRAFGAGRRMPIAARYDV
ncbi:MAG: NAD+ synthase [Firmicutes bacterium HGW-Firmicutes-15]|nr:MAG: NAD+ synthase [Firmicutes bacterium HGW-Firmicutes-15]